MKIINKVVLVCLTIIVSVFSTGTYALASEKRMVIYASHPTKLVDYFVNKFKEKYGSIEVDLITGRSRSRSRVKINVMRSIMFFGICYILASTDSHSEYLN